eukprot:scaffold32171_cov57-Phaeocystis_antarctica.AAC.2
MVPRVKAGVEGVAEVHEDRGGARRGHACRRTHQHRVRCAAARDEQADRLHRVVGGRRSARELSELLDIGGKSADARGFANGDRIYL